MIILTILTVISLASLIYGIHACDETFGFLGFYGFLFCFLGGWIVWGVSTDHTETIPLEKGQYEIVKATNFVEFVVNDDLLLKTKDYSFVLNPEKAKIVKVVEYNHYNKVNKIYLVATL